MTYEANLNAERKIQLQNQDKQTTIALSGDGQNQSSQFTTGKWSQKPQVFAIDEDFLVQINAEDGEKYFLVGENGIRHSNDKPATENAKKVEIKESETEISSMQPMAPMKPMTPLKPMK